MFYSPAVNFSSGYPLGFLPRVGLRLWVLRRFQAFLVSSPCTASATSYHFASIAPPPWRSAFSRFAPVVNLGLPVLASGSNCAVKPTRLRRAAYFRSLGVKIHRQLPSRNIMEKQLRFTIIALLAVLATPAVAQQQQAVDPAVQQRTSPSTKIEAFSAKTGVVMIKGFSTVGRVSGRGIVSVDAREFRDASSPKTGVYGVAIEVKESGRLEREARSFIDQDEIDSLVSGIDYISKISKSVTVMKDFEAEYRTKGDFSITVFSDAGGGLSLAVASGRIGKTSAFLKLGDLDQLKALILEAKKAIEEAKVAAK